MINKLITVAKGFTLIETMLAILLLSTAIAGPLTIASKGMLAAVVAKDQIAAFYLAQDAMEYIRFKRDSNCLTAVAAPGACPAGSWLSGIVGSGLCSADGVTTCYLDSMGNNPSSPTACTGTCPVINFDSSNGYYQYTTGAPTPQRFVRTVKIITPFGGNASQARVLVTVTWNTSGITHTITEKEDITNWQ